MRHMSEPLSVSMNSSADELRHHFAKYGVLIIPGFLSPERVHELNAVIHTHYRPIVRDRFGIDAVGRAGVEFECEVISWDPIAENVIVFEELAADDRLEWLTTAVVGEGFSSRTGLVMWSVGGGKGQAWHQDCPPDDPTRFNINRLFYMQDTGIDDGAVVLVPRSHRAGRISEGGAQDPLPGEITLTPTAGTLVLVHGHLFHRVTPNVSRRPRVSVNLRTYPAGVPDNVNRVGIYRNGAFDFRAGRAVKR